MDGSIVSFVVDYSHAIYDADNLFPNFGSGDDLHFETKSCAKQKAYQFPIRSSSDIFEWTDWEVFLISKCWSNFIHFITIKFLGNWGYVCLSDCH